MIACKFLGRGPIDLPVRDRETVLKFCERIAAETRAVAHEETCPYIIIHRGKIINRADNRHKQLAELIDMEKPLCMTLTALEPPSKVALVKGNLREDGFEPDLKTCAICLEEFTANLIAYKGTFVALPCRHRFHMKCIAEQRVAECPMCREPFEDSLMLAYKRCAESM